MTDDAERSFIESCERAFETTTLSQNEKSMLVNILQEAQKKSGGIPSRFQYEFHVLFQNEMEKNKPTNVNLAFAILMAIFCGNVDPKAEEEKNPKTEAERKYQAIVAMLTGIVEKDFPRPIQVNDLRGNEVNGMDHCKRASGSVIQYIKDHTVTEPMSPTSPTWSDSESETNADETPQQRSSAFPFDFTA